MTEVVEAWDPEDALAVAAELHLELHRHRMANPWRPRRPSGTGWIPGVTGPAPVSTWRTNAKPTMFLSLKWSSAFARALSFTFGPLAHRVEQGTFNPKVVGSRPTRPTR